MILALFHYFTIHKGKVIFTNMQNWPCEIGKYKGGNIVITNFTRVRRHLEFEDLGIEGIYMSRRPRPLTRRQRCVAACETTSAGAIYRPVDLLCSPIWLISRVLAFTFNSILSRSLHLMVVL